MEKWLRHFTPKVKRRVQEGMWPFFSSFYRKSHWRFYIIGKYLIELCNDFPMVRNNQVWNQFQTYVWSVPNFVQ